MSTALTTTNQDDALAFIEQPSKQKRMSKEAIIKRFWSKVMIGTPNECWEWTAGCDKDGYGQFSIGYTGTRAHRFSYLINRGPIAKGMVVCHTCDNPRCVNPSHLWLGTIEDNNRDMKAKGRSAVGQRNGAYTKPETRARGDRHGSAIHPERMLRGSQQSQAKLTEADVRFIRSAVALHTSTQAELSRRFGVSQSKISQIIKRRAWAHIA